jgi:hypothetical protein
MNPWIVEDLIKYERERIRRDMKRIRLEHEAIQANRTGEKTTKARFYLLHLLMQIVPAFIKWIFCAVR